MGGKRNFLEIGFYHFCLVFELETNLASALELLMFSLDFVTFSESKYCYSSLFHFQVGLVLRLSKHGLDAQNFCHLFGRKIQFGIDKTKFGVKCGVSSL